MMGIQYQLAELDQGICFIVFEAPWTWIEFDAMVDNLHTQISSIPHPVATIVDVTQVGRLPAGNVLMHLRRTDEMMPRNVDLSIMVNAPYAITTFMSILMRVRPHVKSMTRYANSVDEARAMIAEFRRQQEHVGK
jgi:hypothetical protein